MGTKAKRLNVPCAVCGTMIDDYASNRRKSKSGMFFCSPKCRGIGVAGSVSAALGGDGKPKGDKKARDAAHYRRAPARYRKKATEWYNRNRDHVLSRLKQRDRELKLEVMASYGGKCECCGEDHIEFLTIDHVNGDGAEHRAALGKGRRIYADIKRQGFPKDKYRCLCFNCNITLGFYGYCPHRPDVRVPVDKQPRNPGRKRSVR